MKIPENETLFIEVSNKGGIYVRAKCQGVDLINGYLNAFLPEMVIRVTQTDVSVVAPEVGVSQK